MSDFTDGVNIVALDFLDGLIIFDDLTSRIGLTGTFVVAKMFGLEGDNTLVDIIVFE